jgi:hypothetical protein
MANGHQYRLAPPAGAVTFAGDALTNRFLVAGCVYHILVTPQYKAPLRKAAIGIAYFSRAVS